MNSPKSFRSLVLHLHPRLIPESAADIRFTWCMGGLAAWMFVLEIITGMLLMFQYAPTGSGAYASIQNITFAAPYGFFIRNLHYWAGQLMVIFVVLHMIRVILTGSYATPRRFNWVIGLALFVVTALVDFTGYILVWDDRSLWAWTIARNLVQIVPIAGPGMAHFLFGPGDPGDAVLIRIYAWHVLFFPALCALLVSWHFWRIRKDGISKPL